MSSPKEQTVTSKSEPWAEAKPYYIDLYKKAQEAFGATNKKVYGGDLWAGPTSLQKKAAKELGANQWQQGAGDLRTLGKDTVSGKYLDPNTNPWLKKTADMAIGDVTRNYTRNVLPNMGSAAISGGAYGGGRQGVMEGLAAGEFGREAGDIATNIYGSNYQQERDRQMQGGNLFNQANQLEAMHLQGMAGAGQQEQQWQQGQLNEDYQRWQQQQAAPWAGIPELMSVLSGGNFQSTSSTGPNPNYMSPMQSMMGVGSLITGLADAFQPSGGWSWMK